MKEINRRNFLGSLGVGASGTLLSRIMPHRETVKNTEILRLSESEEKINPRDIKINVKPVYYALIHSGIWEGPCRYTGGGAGPDAERVQYRGNFAKYIEGFKSSLSQDAKMLEPVYYEFPEFVEIRRKDLKELEADKEEVDLYVVTGTNLSQYLATIIGDIYKKPVAHSRDVAGYLGSKGLEGYVARDFGGLSNLISVLRARKAFQQTNMLIITDFGIPGYPCRACVSDFEELKNRFGIGTTIIRFEELSDERDRVMKSRNIMEEVENLTDKLIRNAQGVHIGREQLKGDVIFHFTVKSLMNEYNCNAFAAECFEFCGTRLPDRWKICPCLNHSLLKDEGYASACEGDICALLAEIVLMNLTKKSALMGNMNVTRKTEGRRRRLGESWETEQWVKGADTEGDKLWVGHNVPGLKMLGFDKPDLPYEIRNFINANPTYPGWGGTLKIDFTNIEEKTVTIVGFGTLATEMLVTTGKVIGMRGFDNTGCSTGAIMEVQDARGFQRKATRFGRHFALTYGDCTQEIAHLADMLKIEVDFHNV